MSRCTTADCLALKIQMVTQCLTPGTTFRWVWTWGSQSFKLLCVLRDHEGRPCLVYWWDHEEEGRWKGYIAFYERVPSAVGGYRTFWVCHCGRRVTALYLPLGHLTAGRQEHFACRHCYGGIPYASQYESKTARIWRRYHEGMTLLRSGPCSLGQRDRIEELTAPALAHAAACAGRAERWISGRQEKRKHKRRPGRPSKRDERERRRAERAAQPKRPPGHPRTKRPYTRRAPLVLSERMNEMQAYCPKCRDRRDLLGASLVTFRNGRRALQGRCAKCGTTTACIVGLDPSARRNAVRVG